MTSGLVDDSSWDAQYDLASTMNHARYDEATAGSYAYLSTTVRVERKGGAARVATPFTTTPQPTEHNRPCRVRSYRADAEGVGSG